jgi:hypothetical protein
VDRGGIDVTIRTRLAAAAVAASAIALTGALLAPTASASTASVAGVNGRSASGSTCATLWTNNRAGSIYACWDWHLNSRGSYNGRYWGTFYDHKKDGKWVFLQAKWKGHGWVGAASAAYGGTYNKDYRALTGLNFRACLTGSPSHCGAPAW